MIYTIKQKVISLKEAFHISDENGNPIYEVKGKVISLGHKLTISDLDGNPIMHVNQKLISLTNEYSIEIEGEKECELNSHITLLQPHYTLHDGKDKWEIKGDFGEFNYTMKHGDTNIASVYHKLLSFGDTYVCECHDDDKIHHLIALGILLAIDCQVHDRNRAVSRDVAHN